MSKIGPIKVSAFLVEKLIVWEKKRMTKKSIIRIGANEHTELGTRYLKNLAKKSAARRLSLLE